MTNLYDTLITVTFKYSDGFHRTFQNIPLWWIPYRARSVPNRFRPTDIYIEGSLLFTEVELQEFIDRFRFLLHPKNARSIRVNGITIFSKHTNTYM